MKTAHRITKTEKPKNQNQKKALKGLSAASIAQRYLELRRLRQQLSEAETWRRAR
jgi:hypothetical protein